MKHFDCLQPSSSRFGKLLGTDWRTGTAGHRLQLHVCHGYAGGGLHHPICARSGFVAHSGRYQFGCRFSSRQYRDGHDSDGRRYGRKCGRLCSQRCRFSSQTEQIQDQQQQEVITQTIPYAYRILSTENETRPDDGAGHDRWLHPHLRVHRLVLHLARDKRTGADLHTGR